MLKIPYCGNTRTVGSNKKIMIIESAFNILPESVAGYGFLRVKREANAVGAFSFSLLNALHSKNVIDPIQRLQLEKPYSTRSAPLPINGANRHCDVFIDYGGSKIGSERLANYGWRYNNYVEAKFLKTYQLTQTGRSTTASTTSAEIIADLIRLVCLVPEPDLIARNQNPKTSSARYFLALSDNDPTIFVNTYLTDLYSVFKNPQLRSRISLNLSTGRPSNYLSNRIGTNFNQLNLTINQATCLAHFPLNTNNANAIWMLLIRIDDATIEWNNGNQIHRYKFALDRSLQETNSGDYVSIRNFVAQNIN